MNYAFTSTSTLLLNYGLAPQLGTFGRRGEEGAERRWERLVYGNWWTKVYIWIQLTIGCLAFWVIREREDWGTLKQNAQVATAYASCKLVLLLDIPLWKCGLLIFSPMSIRWDILPLRRYLSEVHFLDCWNAKIPKPSYIVTLFHKTYPIWGPKLSTLQ